MGEETLQVISITEALDEIRTKILESNENLKKSVMETVLRIKNPNCVMIKDSDMRKIANTLIQTAIMELYGPDQINTKGLNIAIEDD